MELISLHERVIDRDNEDFTSVLQLVVTDVARDMSGRASRAWSLVSISWTDPELRTTMKLAILEEENEGLDLL